MKKGTIRKSLQTLDVRPSPLHRSRGMMVCRGFVLRCALGRNGISAMKREGDGATPLAPMRILGGFARPQRRWPTTAPGLRPSRPNLGWCDAPGDRNYNRPVRLPYAASHERMWRDDGLYDACLVLDWNIRPRKANRGSAIFMHLARPGYAPTEGCIALSPADMRRLLPFLSSKSVVRVRR